VVQIILRDAENKPRGIRNVRAVRTNYQRRFAQLLNSRPFKPNLIRINKCIDRSDISDIRNRCCEEGGLNDFTCIIDDGTEMKRERNGFVI
jgi:hypothetical protein